VLLNCEPTTQRRPTCVCTPVAVGASFAADGTFAPENVAGTYSMTITPVRISAVWSAKLTVTTWDPSKIEIVNAKVKGEVAQTDDGATCLSFVLRARTALKKMIPRCALGVSRTSRRAREQQEQDNHPVSRDQKTGKKMRVCSTSPSVCWCDEAEAGKPATRRESKASK
jgi:hypothetical protein